MKNIKNYLIGNKRFGKTKISDIKKNCSGKTIILGASTRPEIWETLEVLSLELGVLVRTSPLFDIKPKDLVLDHPGFQLISEIEDKNEAETIIIVANTSYIVGLLHFLQEVRKIGIPLTDNIVTNQFLYIKNHPLEEEVKFI